MLNSKPKAERKALVESLTDYQTTRTLISVFLSDPELAFAVSVFLLEGGVVLLEGVWSLFRGVALFLWCRVTTTPKVRTASS